MNHWGWLVVTGGESGGGEFPKLRCWHPLELRGCCCRTVFSSPSLSFPHAVRLLLQIWVFTTTGEYQLRLPPGITFIFSLSLVAGVLLNPLEVEGGGGFLGFTTTSSSSSPRLDWFRVPEDNLARRVAPFLDYIIWKFINELTAHKDSHRLSLPWSPCCWTGSGCWLLKPSLSTCSLATDPTRTSTLKTEFWNKMIFNSWTQNCISVAAVGSWCWLAGLRMNAETNSGVASNFSLFSFPKWF